MTPEQCEWLSPIVTHDGLLVPVLSEEMETCKACRSNGWVEIVGDTASITPQGKKAFADYLVLLRGRLEDAIRDGDEKRVEDLTDFIGEVDPFGSSFYEVNECDDPHDDEEEEDDILERRAEFFARLEQEMNRP